MTIEAMKLALDWIEGNGKYEDGDSIATALRQAIKQAQKQCVCGEPNSSGIHRTDGPCLAPQQNQEPVAWRFQSAVGGWAYGKEPPIGSKYAVESLYTSPPQRQWVGLTDEEKMNICEALNAYNDDLIEAIEAKLKEKNALA